jgi:hypothetical protein
LHLVDDMSDFGPAVGFNTERSVHKWKVRIKSDSSVKLISPKA